MHATWPKLDKMTPTMTHNHTPYGDDELDWCPLEWDSLNEDIADQGAIPMNGFITMGDLGLVEDMAEAYQGSYWPNEPPVLPPPGYYWYNYGPVGRGMFFWKTIPVGKRPSAAEQKADLEKHRVKFEYGQTPDGLVKALAEHGLELPPAKGAKFLTSLGIATVITTIIGVAIANLRSGRR